MRNLYYFPSEIAERYVPSAALISNDPYDFSRLYHTLTALYEIGIPSDQAYRLLMLSESYFIAQCLDRDNDDENWRDDIGDYRTAFFAALAEDALALEESIRKRTGQRVIIAGYGVEPLRLLNVENACTPLQQANPTREQVIKFYAGKRASFGNIRLDFN